VGKALQTIAHFSCRARSGIRVAAIEPSTGASSNWAVRGTVTNGRGTHAEVTVVRKKKEEEGEVAANGRAG